MRLTGVDDATIVVTVGVGDATIVVAGVDDVNIVVNWCR